MVNFILWGVYLKLNKTKQNCGLGTDKEQGPHGTQALEKLQGIMRTQESQACL